MMAAGEICNAETLEHLSDAIHTLAQPLTALSFVVDMALLQNSPQAWKAALENARAETRRAVEALEHVREAVADLREDEVIPWAQLQ